MFRVPWLVSYIQSSFTTTNVTSQNCRIPVPFILDLELIYLESESLSEFSLAFCTGCWHQKTEWEHILPVFSIHFILHCPADLQNTTSKIRWLITQGSRILGSPTKHSVLLSTRPDMIAIQATNIWRYPRQEWMKIDPAPRPRAQLFTFFHQANNSFFHQQKASLLIDWRTHLLQVPPWKPRYFVLIGVSILKTDPTCWCLPGPLMPCPRDQALKMKHPLWFIPKLD